MTLNNSPDIKEKIIAPSNQTCETKSLSQPSQMTEITVVIDIIAECRHGNNEGEDEQQPVLSFGCPFPYQPG